MSKHLDVPPELLSLIEKRSLADRRTQQRRKKKSTLSHKTVEIVPGSNEPSAAELPQRRTKDRRRSVRRNPGKK